MRSAFQDASNFAGSQGPGVAASEQQIMMVALVGEVQAGAKRELDAAKHEAHRFKQTVAIGTVLAFLSAGVGAVLTRLVGG